MAIPQPTGATGMAYFAGIIPPGPGAPHGAVLLRSGSFSGPLFRSDGTAAGTVWVDPTGLPSGYNPGLALTTTTDAFGRLVAVVPSAGVYFSGAFYFPAANGDQRSELWKWDAPTPAAAVPPTVPPVTSQTIAPQVLGVTVNDGSAQRSMVTKLTVAFDRVVDLAELAVTLSDTSGPIRLDYGMIFDPETIDGRTVLTITFGAGNGGSVRDGRLTLTVHAGKVSDSSTGGLLAADYTFNFTRMFGDLNGDGIYDRESRTLVHAALGQHVGQASYIAALDVNSDGVVDATDELAVVRNWGKSV